MFKKVLWISLFLFSTVAISNANGAEFKKWLKQYKKEFQTFVDEHDKEFAQFLKDNWVETEVKPEESRDSAPKITEVPVAEPEPVLDPSPVPKPIEKPKASRPPETRPTPEPKPIELPKPVPPVVVAPEPKPIVLPKPKPKPKPLPEEIVVKRPEPKPKQPVKKPAPQPKTFNYVARGQRAVKVDMLGVDLALPRLKLNPLAISRINSDSLSDSWLSMAKTDFKPAVAAITKASRDLRLDDWGQALLTHEYLTKNGRLSKNEMQLYSWFLLVKQGYDSRIAFNNDQVYLMLKVEQRLFGQKYFNLKDGKYYFVDLGQKRPINVGSVYTYNQQHNSASEQLSIDLTSAPLHGNVDKIRVLKTEVNNKQVAVKTQYNSDYIEFLDHYPQLNMEHYFNAELPEATKSSLLAQLKPHVEGLSEAQALNLLLHFVQRSLSYQTDQQQFNYENYLFAGETLHYPYADCEDRSVLYAYLVKNLLGNDVIGLQYDGHIATAVAVKDKHNGDVFRVNGKNYIVADPTFINANIGRTMTGFENQSPRFIVF